LLAFSFFINWGCLPSHQLETAKQNNLAIPNQNPAPQLNQENFRTLNTNTAPGQLKKTLFDNVIPTQDPASAIPGSVTVIFKNAHGLRIKKGKKSIAAHSKTDQNTLQEILDQYKVAYVDDLAFPGLSEQQMDDDVRNIAQKHGLEAPHRRSMHTYQFPAEANTKEITEKLRALPFVRSAYMTPQVVPLAKPVKEPKIPSNMDILGKTNLLTQTDPKTILNDQWIQGSDSSLPWWFDRHKVFDAWNYYGTTPMPTIAIIDTGFDTRPFALDRPNYIGYMAIQYDPDTPDIGGPGALPHWRLDYSAQDVMELASDSQDQASDTPQSFSHGAMVASIASSPKNNIQGVAGIAPGSSVLAYKIRPATVNQTDGNTRNYIHRNAIAHAIFQASYSSADVISISYGIPGYQLPAESEIFKTITVPLSADPVIGNEILSAISNRNKSVVISAGPPVAEGANLYPDTDITSFHQGTFFNDLNGGTAISPTSTTAWGGFGEIIVGASKRSTISNFHSTRAPISVFSQRIDLVAAGQDVGGSTYLPTVDTQGGPVFVKIDEGTSLATPMVAATVGMMKKISEVNGFSINPFQLRELITFSSTLTRSKDRVSPAIDEQFIGARISPAGTGSGGLSNLDQVAGMRELNVYNALVLAKNIQKYDAIARLFNIDSGDEAKVFVDGNENKFISALAGDDVLVGFKRLHTGRSTIDFRTINNNSPSVSPPDRFTFGHQVYSFPFMDYEQIGGVSHFLGSEQNASRPLGEQPIKSFSLVR